MNAAQKLESNFKQYKLRPSNLNDRISILSFNSGLPMMSYQGLNNYKETYSEHKVAGQYSHERDVDWKDYLPYPTTASFIDKDPDALSDNEKKRIEKLRAVFDKACEIGMITFKTNNDGSVDKHMYIRKFDFTPVENKIKDLKTAIAASDSEQAEAIINGIDSMLNQNAADKTLNLPQIGGDKRVFVVAANAFIDTVRFDNFVRYNGINEDVAKDIKQYDEIVAKVEELRKQVTEKLNNANRLDTFKKALGAGIIDISNLPEISYALYDEFGFPRHDALLSKPSMPFGLIPVYQAFLSFNELDDNQVNDIAQEANNKLNDTNAMKTSLATVKAYLAPQNIQTWIGASRVNYKANATDIQNCLKEIVMYITQTSALFGI